MRRQSKTQPTQRWSGHASSRGFNSDNFFFRLLIDEIILFQRLKRENMGNIVDIQMKRLVKLLEDRKITIALDAKARDWLAEKGYDPAYGARPLKRAIQKAVQDPLAELILSGKVKDGEHVAVSADNKGVTFNGEVAQQAA